ncbi:MAG: hypothetical protein ACREMB_15010, partial [Candidatus Rokuibacteriota bacterium]
MTAIRPVALLALVASGLGLLIGTVIVPDLVLGCLGLVALLIVATPVLFRRRYDVFSPWSFVVLTVFIGVTVRSVHIALRWPDPETIQEMF